MSCRPRPLSATFDDARLHVLAGPVTFQRATQTEAGFEIVYRVFLGTHELHLIYEIDETRRPMQLANAWIAGW